MDVEIREVSDTHMRFVIRGVSAAFVNGLRRILISEVPKMAIEQVEFHMGTIRGEDGREYESKTPLFDEIIAHRLAMIPIPTDLSIFNFKDQCTCGGEGCPNCEIIYALNKVGPCTIYSGDLEPLGGEAYAVKEKLIPIVKLNEHQAILAYAIAVLGRGKDHAKWQAAHAVGYRYYPSIEVDNDRCDLCGSCVDACPRQIIAIEEKRVITREIEACNLCRACQEVCEMGALRLNPDETSFIFKFETDGSLTAQDALLEALRIAAKKFDDFRTSLAELGK